MATRIAGVDEVGRGPLAGPVLASAVILNPRKPIVGLADSKALSVKNRELLCETIKKNALCWTIGIASVKEIDEMNILNASLLAMTRAIEKLNIVPQKIYVDGNRCPDSIFPVQAVVGGDALIDCISAASIVAKVTRDYLMRLFKKTYPQYGFEQHKGYSTVAHIEALKKFGVTKVHRRSFSPVKMLIA